MKVLLGAWLLVLFVDSSNSLAFPPVHRYTIFTFNVAKESPRNAHGVLSIRLTNNGKSETLNFNEKSMLFLPDSPMHATKKVTSIPGESTIELLYTRSNSSKARFILMNRLFVQDDQRGQSFNLCGSFLNANQWTTLSRC